MKRKLNRLLRSSRRLAGLPARVLLAAFLPSLAFLPAGAQFGAAPSISLAASSASGPVAAITPGTAITLSATVTQGSGKVAHGIIRFCDLAVSPRCTHESRIASAQVLANGTATVHVMPAPGAHSYQAVLYGQQMFSLQLSNTLPISVAAPVVAPVSGIGSSASSTTLTKAGTTGAYSLTATVTTSGNAPTGSVSFLDQTRGSILATAPLIASTPAAAASSLLSFTSGTLATGIISGNSSVATGDFNHDGKLDAVLVGSDSSSVTVLLGNGDGTFTPAPAALLPINGIYQIKVADFNQDGNPDLALINLLNNQIDFLLGNGDGTFTMGTEIYAGGGPIGVTVADFNGDGIPDLIRANTYAGTVTFLAGKGDGTFTPGWQSYVNTNNPTIPVAGDFNNDGLMDFAVIGTNSAQLAIYLGDGDGTFTQQNFVPTGKNPSFLAAADFNSDGKLDLAVTNSGDNTVSILLGNGDGTFALKQTVPTPAGTVDIQVADFNADGKLDLAVSATTANAVSILTGAGDGTFTLATTAPAGASPYQIAVGDFNHDGSPDVLAADTTNAATLILTQAPTHTFTATATVGNIAVLGAGSHTVVASFAGDSNNAASVSTAATLTGAPQKTALALYVSNSLPVFGSQVALTANLSPYAGSNGESVTFLVDGKVLGTAVLNSGSATLQTTSLAVGIHSLTVSYAGDASLIGSTAQSAILVWKLW